MEQYTAVAIMFLATVVVASGFMVPVTLRNKRSGVLNFYWKGFWVFLAIITGFAGASSTLMLMGQENGMVSTVLLSGLMIAYVTFVVVAWFHLTGHVVLKFINKVIKRSA